MIQKLTHITILVKDQDQALKFYTEKLGFEMHTDVDFNGMRWLTVCPAGQKDMEFCLMKAATQEDLAQVGKQGGSFGIGCLSTNDCQKTYEELKAKGIEFVGEPKKESWGIGVILKDLYGNTFYLNQAPQ